MINPNKLGRSPFPASASQWMLVGLRSSGVATGYSLSGPGAGGVGTPSTNFTVTITPSGGTVTGTVTVTPSDSGGGGTFTPSTVALTTASPSATFTYTAASAGIKTISTTNNGGLTDPSSLSYIASAALHLLNGLISYWKLDETGGLSTLADAHGTNPLTYSSGATTAFSGIINNGQYFTGTTTRAAHASNSDLQVTGSFFFSLWVRVDDNIAFQGILCKDNFTTLRDYVIFYDGTSSSSLGFGFAVGGSTNNILKGSLEIQYTWHHLVCWYDSADQKVRMRVDDAVTYVAATGGALVQTAQPFSLGRDTTEGNGFTGILDEIGFWKGRIPTAAEMTALYNGGAGLPYSSFNP